MIFVLILRKEVFITVITILWKSIGPVCYKNFAMSEDSLPVSDISGWFRALDNLFLVIFLSIDRNIKRLEYYDSILFYLLR